MPCATVQSGLDRWAHEYERRPGTFIFSRFYTPFPKQREFHCRKEKYRLFGGAAGPGKSKALLMEAILQAHEHRGVNTMVLRRTFPELESSLLQYFRTDIPRELYRSYNESKHLVTWRNGSTTRFGYCKNESDVYQYPGAEFLFIGIDELSLFTLRQWQFLTSRNRCPVPGAFANMAGATNPGNIGHAWVKALWIDREPATGMERPEQYDADDYGFIPARVWDNPIYANDTSYLKTLKALPTHMRQAFLEGNWNIFAGQYFDRFDVAKHTERAENIGLQTWWPRWVSIDWGFEHQAATYWHASAPQQQEGSTPGGAGRTRATRDAARVVTYRELIRHRVPPRALAEEIIDRSHDATGKPERIDAIYLSPDAFAHRTDEASIAEQMGSVFAAAGLPRPVAADNDRIGGWMLMYQMLDAGEWIITDNCSALVRVLPTLVRDHVYIEDIEKADGDDPADAARYGLKSRIRSAKPPIENRLAAWVTSPDPTVRAIQARRALLEEGRQSSPVFRRGRRPGTC